METNICFKRSKENIKKLPESPRVRNNTPPAEVPLSNTTKAKTEHPGLRSEQQRVVSNSTDRHTGTALNRRDQRPRHLRVRTGPGGCWSASASGRRRAASSSARRWPESPGGRRACRAWRALPSRSQTWITATQSHSYTLDLCASLCFSFFLFSFSVLNVN